MVKFLGGKEGVAGRERYRDTSGIYPLIEYSVANKGDNATSITFFYCTSAVILRILRV
jgi:hypothetical protein